jgi:GST-like protein
MTGSARQTEQDLTAWLWATPNSNRISVLFEELGLAYRVVGVNIRKKEQFAPEIVALNPYGKVPIVRWQDQQGEHVLFESGAILLDFADRHGRFLPSDRTLRQVTLSWLMVALTGLAPTMGQAHHWTDLAPEKSDAAVAHSVAAVKRVYRLLDQRLEQSAFLADAYSIADIAALPWIARSHWATLDLADYPHLRRWHDELMARPAVQRGMAIPVGARLED